AKAPATLRLPPPAPEIAVAAKSCRPSPAAVTSACTVAGPMTVPAIVAGLGTFARLIATPAPMPVGGPRATVALPSAFAFASELADENRVRPLEVTVTPVGSAALDEVVEMLTETAAATATDPPDVLAGGAAGVEPESLTLFVVATSLPKVRWLATWV